MDYGANVLKSKSKVKLETPTSPAKLPVFQYVSRPVERPKEPVPTRVSERQRSKTT